MKGKFITFEGSEGSGKSTQSKLLAAYLRQKGFRVAYLREPGGTAVSEKIRGILLDKDHRKMCAECETLLYMAARAQVVDEIILPALSEGKIIVCDRFLDSTLAYQGYGLGVNLKIIKDIGSFATAGIRPDLTIFMDLPVHKGLKHRDGAKDRIEKRSLAYHCRVRNGYLAMARKEPGRIKAVKVQKEKMETQRLIRELTDIFLAR